MRLKFTALLSLGLLMVVLGCGEKMAQQLIERLKSKDREVRLDASHKLLVIGKPAVEPLIQVVRSGDERSRFIGAQLLGKIGDTRAVEPLIEMLNSDSVPLRQAAVEALGKLADERCVQPLSDLLIDDPVASIRVKAAEALGFLKYIEAEDVLVEALGDSSAEVRRGALIALDSFWDSRLDSIFVKMSEDANDNVRYTAVQILRRSKIQGTLTRFIELLSDNVPDIRQEAAYALGEIGDKKAVDPLVKMLVKYYDDEADRRAAQETLKKLTGTEYKVRE